MYPIIPRWIRVAPPQRRRQFAISELPKCTRMLSYAQDDPPGARGLSGVFRFDRRDLGNAVLRHLKDNAFEGNKWTQPDHELFEWFKNHDPDSVEVVSLPSRWEGIEICLLRGVIEPGKYTVTCVKCGTEYQSSQVHEVQEALGDPYLYDSRACPAGHVLSRIVVMHVLR
jgi:hypothetical protein